jgi:integrase
VQVADDGGLTVDELCCHFLDFCRLHYLKGGRETSEVQLVVMTIKPLHEAFGDVPVSQFGPRLLKTFRDKLIELDWCRNTINQTVGRFRRMVKWAVAEKLVGPEVLQRLQAVPALRSGRTEAPDRRKRTAVSQEHIDAVKAKVRPLVRDMIDVQVACGARSGELLGLTTPMIDRTGAVWVATLADHKTAHHGHIRKLYFPPSVQPILLRYLSADPTRPLFKITRCAYCRAITWACEDLKIPTWVPHELRNTFVTRIRELHGIEAAQVLAGHSSPDMTAVYSTKMGALATATAAKLA